MYANRRPSWREYDDIDNSDGFALCCLILISILKCILVVFALLVSVVLVLEIQQTGNLSAISKTTYENFDNVMSLDGVKELKNIIQNIPGYVKRVIEIILTVFMTILISLMNILQYIFENGKSLFSIILSLSLNTLQSIFENGKNLFSIILSLSLNTLQSIFENGKNLVSIILSVLLNTLQYIFEHGINLFSNILSVIMNILQNSYESGKSLFKRVQDSPLPREAYDNVKKGLERGVNALIGKTENPPEFVMLLIGKTGVGKSTAGNAILGNNTFKAALSASSVTTNTTLGTSVRFGRKLVVVDTPGLHDTTLSNEEVLDEISKCYAMTSPGFHAIILVAQLDRFTPEDEDTVDFFVNHFGDALYRYLIIISAGRDALVREKKSLEEYIETLAADSKLNELLNKIHHDRKMAFGLENNEYEVQNLISMIDQMSDHGKYHYTNEMYKKAEAMFQQRLKKEIEKIKKEKEREVDKFVREFKIKAKLTAENEKKLFKQLLDEKMKEFEQKFREKTREEINEETSWFLKSVKELVNDLKSWFSS